MRKKTRKTTRKPDAGDAARPRRRLSGKTRRQLAGDNPYAAPHYGPTDSFRHMEEEMVDIYRALFGLVTCAALLPFVLVYMAIDEIARRKRRRAYYEREKEKRIELANKKRMKLGEYAKPGDIAEGDDGKYYVYDREEFARRVALESERRRIRRHATLNKCPTSAELKAQWAKVRESHVEMLRFGSMLCDLEAYVDNGIMFDGNGDFAGRKPGVKGWLTEHCPEIRARYVTAMRYKAMAVRARQAIGMDEPHPLGAVLGGVTGEADDGPNGAGGGGSPAVGGRLLNDDEILRLNTVDKVTEYAEQNQRDDGKNGNVCRCGHDGKSDDDRLSGRDRRCNNVCISGNDRRCNNVCISGNDRRCNNDCISGNDLGSNDGGEKIADGAADGRMAEWRRKLQEILDDAERRDGRVRRRGGRPKRNVANGVDGNGGADGANGGKTAGSADGEKTVAAGERRGTQAALVQALEAVSEPLWALVKSVGPGDGAQTA